jgi:hypothetical protein
VEFRHRQWARKGEFVRKNIATLYDIPDVNELPSFDSFDPASWPKGLGGLIPPACAAHLIYGPWGIAEHRFREPIELPPRDKRHSPADDRVCRDNSQQQRLDNLQPQRKNYFTRHIWLLGSMVINLVALYNCEDAFATQREGQSVEEIQKVLQVL